MPTEIEITERICLGRVREHRVLSDGVMIAPLDPIAISNSDRTAWEIVGFGVAGHFPDRGRVWWYKAPSTIRDEAIWEFVVELHPKKKGDGHGEKFQVDNTKGPREITEVMDLRRAGGEKAVRDGLLGGGFKFPLRPLSNKVYLLIENDELLGPIEVIPMVSNSSLYTLVDVESDKLNRIEVWEIPAMLLEVDFFGTKRLPMQPGNRPLVRKSDVFKNWESDHSLLTRSLKWLVDHDAETMTSLCLNTKKVIKAFADNLKKHHLDKEELRIALARKERLLELGGLVERNAEVLEAAASVLLRNERVQMELREKVAVETDRLRKEEERRIAEELKIKQAELAEAERKSKEQKERLKKLERDCKLAEARLEAKTKPYTEEFAKKLAEIAKEPHKGYSELAFLRSIFGGESTQGRSSAGLDPMAVLPQGRILRIPSDTTKIEDIGQFIRRLGLRMLSRRIDDAMASQVTAAFLSGRIPMLEDRKSVV